MNDKDKVTSLYNQPIKTGMVVEYQNSLWVVEPGKKLGEFNLVAIKADPTRENIALKSLS